MMIHHSDKDYNVAASEAATHARAKIDALIEKGRASASHLLERVLTQVPQDRIVPAARLAERIQVVNAAQNADAQVAPRLVIDFGTPQDPTQDSVQTIHRNALNQLTQRADVPFDFARRMIDHGEWGAELVAHTLREIYKHDTSKYLVRSLDGEVRGFLSDKYRRLDSRPLLEAFAEMSAELGLVPVEGTVTDTKVALKMMLPLVFEPITHEVMTFGLSWGNSDFGNGGHTVNVFVLRLACTNMATFENALRQVHLGKRLDENFEYSQRTYELDNAASVSALKDTVRGALGPGVVNNYLEALKAAGTEKIDTGLVVERLKKRLSKAETTQVVEAFSSAEIEMLPPGPTNWRLSNALSWIAQKQPDAERRLELEAIAGEVLSMKKVA